MEVWVTGGTGQIGSRLCDELEAQGHHVSVISRRPKPDSVECGWACCDLARSNSPLAQLPSPEAVFHLAGQTSAYRARMETSADVGANVLGFVRLLEVVRDRGTNPLVVTVGAVTEVGLPAIEAVNDATELQPLTFYDVAKVCQELYLRQFEREGVLTGVVLRVPNVFGGLAPSSGEGRGFLNASIARAVGGLDLTCFADHRYVRDYLYVDDAVDALLACLPHRVSVAGGSYMVGTGIGTAISEVLQIVADEVTAISGHPVLVTIARPSGFQYEIEGRDYVVDPSGFCRLTGWTPRTPLREGIRALALSLWESRGA